MFKVFAFNILDEVASECESKMHSEISKKKAEELDNISKMLTNAMIEMSSQDDSDS